MFTVAQQVHEGEEVTLELDVPEESINSDEGRVERQVQEDPTPQEPSVPGEAIIHELQKTVLHLLVCLFMYQNFTHYKLNGWIMMNTLMYFCTMQHSQFSREMGPPLIRLSSTLQVWATQDLKERRNKEFQTPNCFHLYRPPAALVSVWYGQVCSHIYMRQPF